MFIVLVEVYTEDFWSIELGVPYSALVEIMLRGDDQEDNGDQENLIISVIPIAMRILTMYKFSKPMVD